MTPKTVCLTESVCKTCSYVVPPLLKGCALEEMPSAHPKVTGIKKYKESSRNMFYVLFLGQTKMRVDCSKKSLKMNVTHPVCEAMDNKLKTGPDMQIKKYTYVNCKSLHEELNRSTKVRSKDGLLPK